MRSQAWISRIRLRLGPKPMLSASLIALPLLVLAADILHSGLVFLTCRLGTNVTLDELEHKRPRPRGFYLGHEFFLSRDDISDPDYLGYLGTKRTAALTALVIDVDHTLDKNNNTCKTLESRVTQKVLSKLRDASLADFIAATQLLQGQEPDLGGIKVHLLRIPDEAFPTFPVDYLYIVGVKACAEGETKSVQLESLKDSLREAMKKAHEHKLSNLVIPTIGISPEPRAIDIKNFLPNVLSVTTPDPKPTNIYLDLYRSNGDYLPGHEVRTVNKAWTEVCDDDHKQSLLVQEPQRLIMLGLFICLVVSSRSLTIDLKAFVNIATSFVVSACGMWVTLHFFAGDWNAIHRFWLELAILIALATLFPVFPWNQSIFNVKQPEHE